MTPIYKANVSHSADGTAISYPLDAFDGPEPRTSCAMTSEVELLCKLLVPLEADDELGCCCHSKVRLPVRGRAED